MAKSALILTILLFFLGNQNLRSMDNPKQPVLESKPACLILDTLEVLKRSVLVRVLWFNDTLVIRRSTEIIEGDILHYRKIHNSSTYLPTEKEKESYGTFYTYFSQNCFSYALEKYFEHGNFEQVKIFDSKTSVLSESTIQILANSFEKVQQFSVNHRKLISPKVDIEDNTLLILKGKDSTLSHAIFYAKKLFYTKNGAFKPKVCTRIGDILKDYWDTATIEVYRIRSDKKTILLNAI